VIIRGSQVSKDLKMLSSGVLVIRNENGTVIDSSENELIDQKSKYMLSHPDSQ
jgi:hypothetical protein